MSLCTAQKCNNFGQLLASVYVLIITRLVISAPNMGGWENTREALGNHSALPTLLGFSQLPACLDEAFLHGNALYISLLWAKPHGMFVSCRDLILSAILQGKGHIYDNHGQNSLRTQHFVTAFQHTAHPPYYDYVHVHHHHDYHRHRHQFHHQHRHRRRHHQHHHPHRHHYHYRHHHHDRRRYQLESLSFTPNIRGLYLKWPTCLVVFVSSQSPDCGGERRAQSAPDDGRHAG